ncbi:hypothetical protein BCR42DRAFT_412238 [Absidia repens]|uniref:PB1 domain-containing protein n=1 Tax=Absidia repens TaxID=90262 RepID=A0A1X2IJA2_9FUNG|nr:hypothetical protein BCR42DRAFT_412238 [Absidia repens]
MAMKFELEQWQNACVAFDSKDYDSALKTFISLADNAKMHFNIGLVFAAVDDHERALAAYSRSIALDPYFAVAYFQKGVSQFCIGNMQEAMQDFDNAHMKLRGNPIINYQQLGLAFRLYSCEVLFNRGICRLYLGKIDAGLTDLYHAQKSKMTEEHDVIDQAVRDRGKGYSVFSIPVGVLYRPPESRLRQMHDNMDMFAAVDKLGLSKLQKPIMPGAAAAGAEAINGGGSLGRNNSVLLSSAKFQRKQSLGFSSFGKSTPMRQTTSQQQPSSTPTSSLSGYNNGPPPWILSLNQHPPYPQQNNSNNSIPLSSSSSSFTSSALPQQYRQYNPAEQQQQRTRKDSNPLLGGSYSSSPNHQSHDDWAETSSQPSSSTSSFTSSLRYRTDGRRVDSGFESSQEDRFSFSSRNSAKSHKTNRYSPPPVPPIPKSSSSTTTTLANHSGSGTYDEVFDPMSYSQFDNTATTTTTDMSNDFQHMTIEDERDRIRGRFHSNASYDSNDSSGGRHYRRGSEHSGKSTRSSTNGAGRRTPQPSTSTSSSTTAPGSKIKIKVHYTDTRVLLVASTITFDALISRVREKLHAPAHTRLQYKDEDNEMVLMIDDDDLQMARQIYKVRNNQDLGVEKMEIWCVT